MQSEDTKVLLFVPNASQVGFSSGLCLDEDWTSRGQLVSDNMPNSTKARRAYVAKAAETARRGTEVILSATSRTDAQWFHDAWDSASAVCFWRGRLSCANEVGEEMENPPKLPTVFFYWGPHPAEFCRVFGENNDGAPNICQVIPTPRRAESMGKLLGRA